MAVSISWQHSWSSSDDGSILYGSDLQYLQVNIEAHTHTETVNITGTQTAAGNKTFSGVITISGTLATVFYEGALVSYEEDFVYY